MNLRVYLATKNMTFREFSQILDINPCYMSRIINGFRPGRKLARNITKATDGLVVFNLEEKKTTEESIEPEKARKSDQELVF